MTDKERRLVVTLQIVALMLILSVAAYFAVVTNNQNRRLATEAEATARRTGEVMGAFIDYATCVSIIPIEERSAETLEHCYKILREADIPISVPVPTPSPSGG